MAGTGRSICGGLQIEEALRTMRVRSHAVSPTAQTLRTLGFEEALDLQLLLPSGPEQMELMEELRVRGASIADRGKIRLLLNGDVHATSDAINLSAAGAAAAACAGSEAQPLQSARQLQEAATASSGQGISTDTLAIVLSVLVGAAGYLVQVGHQTVQALWTWLGLDARLRRVRVL